MKETESAQLAQLCFALEGHSGATLMLIACDSQTTRARISQYLQDQFPSQPAYELDLSGVQVESLNRSLRENLPEQILTATAPPYLVHVSGLEDSLFISEGGKIQVSTLVAQLNFERETLFRDFPFTTIIWTDPHFLDVLKRQAPDLWSWLVYVYEFESETPTVSEPVQPQAYPELVPGLTPERQARIANLESKYAQLNLKEAKERVLREKLNLQKLLGREYAEVHDYEKSIKAYRTAQSLLEQLKDDGSELLEVLFNLGTVYLNNRLYSDSIKTYNQSLLYQKKLNDFRIRGATYHQIGRIYEEQHQWTKAIYHYEKALHWHKKLNHEIDLGSTYHQIGMVFEEQGKWTEAIQNYQRALLWNQKTGNFFVLGNTYHHLGSVFFAQKKWQEAIQNYHLALNLYKESNNEFSIGFTYHQLGMVYAEQKKWGEALEYYQKAIDLYKKTHNDFGLGTTYHQVGMLFEDQEKWGEAIQNYKLALYWKQKTNNEFDLGGTYHQLGIVFARQDSWIEAIENFENSIRWNKKTNNEFTLYKTYWGLGTVYTIQKHYQEAILNYKNALDCINKYPPPEANKIINLILNDMAELPLES